MDITRHLHHPENNSTHDRTLINHPDDSRKLPATSGKSATRPMPPLLLEDQQQTQTASAIADATKNE